MTATNGGLLTCPTCNSHNVNLHPATSQGEVTKLCEDEFHGPRWRRVPVVTYDKTQVDCLVRWVKAPPVEGCRWCGHDRFTHGSRWTHGKKYHVFHYPTDAQREARAWALVNVP